MAIHMDKIDSGGLGQIAKMDCDALLRGGSDGGALRFRNEGWRLMRTRSMPSKTGNSDQDCEQETNGKTNQSRAEIGAGHDPFQWHIQ